ncbi:MAG: carboxylating nicotinate-nucleotide diphosphorylase [Clostridia bacterium]|nr:carboxylating nicotinate-nucleotide diphosphorylase [Clostridia bacterium]
MNLDEVIKQALAEDIGSGDHTSLSTIPAAATGEAQLLIKADGVVAGIGVAQKVFEILDPTLQFKALMKDGTPVKVGDIVFTISGSSRSILTGERLALNFMQRLSGIATATQHMADLIAHTSARLLDTRKTTPLLRQLEKQAVVAGGGTNHRYGLYDMILIKDNHVDFAGGIPQAIEAAHRYMQDKKLNLKIEIEVRNFDELQQVLDHGGVNRVMLDNFTPEDLRHAVRMIAGRVETEASGRITAENIRSYAETGVNFISSGALTHQIKSLDMSLKAVHQLQN